MTTPAADEDMPMERAPAQRDLLEAMGALAAEAGRRTMQFYFGECSVSTKPDGSSVTQADLASEAAALPGLARIAPGVPVVSEESAPKTPPTGGRFFLVDPLDGTREFLSRNGEFTVNIALIEDGAPTLGAIHAPALGRTWIGGAGLGAWRIEADGARRAIATRIAPAALVAVGSRSHMCPQTSAWLERLNVERLSAAGSSLKFCLVAEGAADVYPRLGRTMQWDTAAGDAVLRAAGGTVTRLDGEPLFYGADAADFANPGFVAWGDPALARARAY